MTTLRFKWLSAAWYHTRPLYQEICFYHHFDCFISRNRGICTNSIIFIALFVIVESLLMKLTTNIWYRRKLPLLTISRLWRYCGASNYRFNFLLYWYAPWLFFRSSMCFRVPIYVRKYRKYTIDRWIMLYIVCAYEVISPLRQWLDSYAKTRLKMCHTFKHFIHMQY